MTVPGARRRWMAISCTRSVRAATSSASPADSGKVVWTKNLLRDLGGASNPGWKFSESPLIDGDRLLCTPGGHKAVIAALNKKTGETIWRCSMPDIGNKGKDEAGYSSIVISNAAGVKQYVQLTNEGVVGVSADGKFLWGYNRVANGVANISTCVIDGDYVFTSTAYQTGSALLKLVPDGDGVKAEEVYWLDKDQFQNHHGGFVKVGDYIYGGHNHNKGEPTCVEMKTGKILWHAANQPGKGSGCVLYADGHLYFRYEDGSGPGRGDADEVQPQEHVQAAEASGSQADGLGVPGDLRRQALPPAWRTSCSATT